MDENRKAQKTDHGQTARDALALLKSRKTFEAGFTILSANFGARLALELLRGITAVHVLLTTPLTQIVRCLANTSHQKLLATAYSVLWKLLLRSGIQEPANVACFCELIEIPVFRYRLFEHGDIREIPTAKSFLLNRVCGPYLLHACALGASPSVIGHLAHEASYSGVFETETFGWELLRLFSAGPRAYTNLPRLDGKTLLPEQFFCLSITKTFDPLWVCIQNLPMASRFPSASFLESLEVLLVYANFIHGRFLQELGRSLTGIVNQYLCGLQDIV